METVNTLEPATATDRSGVVSLLTALQLPTSDLPPELDNFVIAKENNVVIGTGGLEIFGQEALLRSLAVATDQQGKGLGHLLYEAVLDLAKTKGVTQVYLITNTAAAFFAKKDFTQIDRNLVPAAIQGTGQFKSVCPTSATVMYKKIK